MHRLAALVLIGLGILNAPGSANGQNPFTRGAANALYPQKSRISKWVPLCARTQANDGAGLSDGVCLGALVNIKYVADINGTGLRVCWANNFGTSIGAIAQQEQLCPNAVTLQWGYWYGSTFVQGYWQGQTSITVQPGQYVVSDEMAGVPVVAGTTYNIAFRVTVPSGQFFPSATYSYLSGANEDYINNGGSSGGAIPTISTLLTNTAGEFGTFCVMPLRIETCTVNPPQVVALAGDSLTSQSGGYDAGTPFNVAGFRNPAYPRQVVQAAGGLSQSLGLSSDEAYLNQFPSFNFRTQWLDGVCTRAWVLQGTNDTGNPTATTESNLVAMGAMFAARGMRPAISTLLPRCNTGDPDWYCNPATQVSSANRSNRETLLSWMRGGGMSISTNIPPAPFEQVFDIYSAVATGWDTDRWANSGYLSAGGWGNPTISTISMTGGSTTTAQMPCPNGTLTGAHQYMVLFWQTGANAGTYSSITVSTVSGTMITDTFSTLPFAVSTGDTAYLIAPYTQDGTHPNEWGIAAIVAALKTQMSSWLSSS